MPLYSEHISNMYYGGSPSYSGLPYSYGGSVSPLGSSYSASYLNPGGNYSNHSSLSGYSRAPISSRWISSSGRSYSPMLSTISERVTGSPVRINSPRRIPISNRSYGTSGYIPRPININTADIDVSRDKYRRKIESSVVVSPKSSPKKDDSNESKEQGPFMPRVDGKPETGIDSSPGTQRSTIKRGRTVVRLHTIKRRDRDSPRKPPEESKSDKSDDMTPIINEPTEKMEDDSTEIIGWREKLSEDLIYKGKKEKKSLGTKLVEKFIIKDEDSDYSLHESTKRKNNAQTLPAPSNASTNIDNYGNKSPDRRCSMELLAEQANLLDSLIRKENLSTTSLDLSKVGIEEKEKEDSLKLISRKFSNNQNPLKTTKSDHSLHNSLKSFKDPRQLSKRRSLKKSSSGGSICRLDSITEFPKEPIISQDLPSIEEHRQSIKNVVTKLPADLTPQPKVSTQQPDVLIEPPTVSNPKPEVKPKVKPKLKTKITSSVEVSPPKSPLKFKIENVTVEERPRTLKKEIVYSAFVDEGITEDKTAKENELNRNNKNRRSIKKKSKNTGSISEDAMSPDPEDGNFWDKIGKRETVYLIKRKQFIDDVNEKNKRALFWFPEEEETANNEKNNEAEEDVLNTKTFEEEAFNNIGQFNQDDNINTNLDISFDENSVKNAKLCDTEPFIGVVDHKQCTTQAPANCKDLDVCININMETPADFSNNIEPIKVEIVGNLSQEHKKHNTDDVLQIVSEKMIPLEENLDKDNKDGKNKEYITPDKKDKVEEDKEKDIKRNSLTSNTLQNIDALQDVKALNNNLIETILEKGNQKPSNPAVCAESTQKSGKTSEECYKNIELSKNIKTSLSSKITDDKKIKSGISCSLKKVAGNIEANKKTNDSNVSSEDKHEKTDNKTTLTETKDIKNVPNTKDSNELAKQNVKIIPHEFENKKSFKLVKDTNISEPTTEQNHPSLKSGLTKDLLVEEKETNEDLSKENIPNQNNLETSEILKQSTKVGEDKKADSIPKVEEQKDNTKLSPGGVIKLPQTPSPRRPVKDEPALRPLIATPRPLQKKVPQVIHSSSSSESSSSEDSSEDEDADESDTSEASAEFYECENNTDGRTSTGSNDSGFDSSAPTSPAGFVQIKKDCDVNCHRKCEKLTANLCGVNQRLLVEALASRNSSRKGGENPGTSTSTAHAHSDATDILEQELEQSTAYGLFRKTGRFTPPARSIPRFRKYAIDDFHFIKVLGKGSFGKVLLAELRETEYYYAVKCLKKDVVLEDDDVECTLIERKVLALGTNHPYLCHLFATFQTDSHLFFVMEYLNGGDLMFHIQQSGRFPEARARFYAAEIVSGLKFLHKRGIVYRDLKLDNILLDFEGHVRIADFGMCKLQIYLDKTADTFCGTPDYMAPEIIKGLKYNQAVDWWSFGVLLYEMLIGQSPFSGCDEDELFWSICNEVPSYPRFLSQDALTILTRLLDKDARSRLGGAECMHGDIRDQEFFRAIHWDRLERRELEAPFKPRVRHPLDTQYFDRAFTGERPRLTAVEPQVLRSMDQEPFRGFSYTNPNATDR